MPYNTPNSQNMQSNMSPDDAMASLATSNEFLRGMLPQMSPEAMGEDMGEETPETPNEMPTEQPEMGQMEGEQPMIEEMPVEEEKAPEKPEIEEELKRYKLSLAERGATIADDIRAEAGGQSVVLIPNKFPYDIPGSEQFLLWILHDDSWVEADSVLAMFLQERGVRHEDVVCYENNSAYQTEPGITHFHVMIPSH